MERVSYLEAREATLEASVSSRDNVTRKYITAIQENLPAAETSVEVKMGNRTTTIRMGSPSTVSSPDVPSDIVQGLESIHKSVASTTRQLAAVKEDQMVLLEHTKRLDADNNMLRAEVESLQRAEAVARDTLLRTQERTAEDALHTVESLRRQMEVKETEWRNHADSVERDWANHLRDLESAAEKKIRDLEDSRASSLLAQERHLVMQSREVEEKLRSQTLDLQEKLLRVQRDRDDIAAQFAAVGERFEQFLQAGEKEANESVQLLVERVQGLKAKQDRLKLDLEASHKETAQAVALRDEAVQALRKLMAAEHEHLSVIRDLETKVKASVPQEEHQKILHTRVKDLEERHRSEREALGSRFQVEKEDLLKKATAKAKEDLTASLIQIRRGVHALEAARDEHSRLRTQAEQDKERLMMTIRQLEGNIQDLQTVRRSQEAALEDYAEQTRRLKEGVEEEARRRKDAEELQRRHEHETKLNLQLATNAAVEATKAKCGDEYHALRMQLEELKADRDGLALERERLLMRHEEAHRTLSLDQEASSGLKQQLQACENDKRKALEEVLAVSKQLAALQSTVASTRHKVHSLVSSVRKEVSDVKSRSQEELRAMAAEAAATLVKVDQAHVALRRTREAALHERLRAADMALKLSEKQKTDAESALEREVRSVVQRCQADLEIQEAKLVAEREAVTAKLQAEIVSLRNLAESEVNNAENRAAAEASAIEARLRHELTNLEARYRSEKEATQAKHLQAVQQIRDEARTEISALESKLDKSTFAVREEARLQVLAAEETKKKAIEEAHTTSKRATEEADARAVQRVRRAEDELESVIKRSDEKIRGLEEKLRQIHRQAEDHSVQQIKQAEEKFDRLLREEQLRAAQEIKEAAERAGAAVREAHERANANVRAAVEKSEWEVKSANERCAQICKEAMDRAERDVREVKEISSEETRELRAALDVARRALEDAHTGSDTRVQLLTKDWELRLERDVGDLRAKYETQLAALTEHNAGSIREIHASTEARVKAAEREAIDAVKQSAEKADRLQSDLDRTKEHLASSAERATKEYAEQAKRHADELQRASSKLTEELEALKKKREEEVASLATKLQSETTRLSNLTQRAMQVINSVSSRMHLAPSLVDRLTDPNGSPAQGDSNSTRGFDAVLKEFEGVMDSEMQKIINNSCAPFKQQIEALNMQNTQLGDHAGSLTTELAQLNAALGQLREEKNALEARLREIRAHTEQLTESLNAEKAAKAAVERKFDDATAEFEVRMSDTRNELDAVVKARIGELERVVESLQAEHKSALSKADQSRESDAASAKKDGEKRLDEANRLHEQASAALKASVDRKSAEVVELQEEVRVLKVKLKDATSKVDDLENNFKRRQVASSHQHELETASLQARLAQKEHQLKLSHENRDVESMRHEMLNLQRQATLNKLETISQSAVNMAPNATLLGQTVRSNSSSPTRSRGGVTQAFTQARTHAPSMRTTMDEESRRPQSYSAQVLRDALASSQRMTANVENARIAESASRSGVALTSPKVGGPTPNSVAGHGFRRGESMRSPMHLDRESTTGGLQSSTTQRAHDVTSRSRVDEILAERRKNRGQ